MYYGYRCYNKDGEDEGWLYTARSEQELNPTKNPKLFDWCKRWKTERGAKKNFDFYNRRWHEKTDGGHLKIEVMPEIEVEQNTDEVNDQDDETNPIWDIEFQDGDKDVLQWLNEQRLDDESNQELVMRLLRQLMNKDINNG